jgi:hypothetical protein
MHSNGFSSVDDVPLKRLSVMYAGYEKARTEDLKIKKWLAGFKV